MASLLFHPWAGSHVLQVARPTRKFSYVQLDGLGDKLRSGTEGGRFLIVLVLQQVFGIREILQQLLDEFLLGLGDRSLSQRLVQLLNPLPGGDVFGIAAAGFSTF